MTGPEHYREAERLLNASLTVLEGQEVFNTGYVCVAAVHASLALAAATALSAIGGYPVSAPYVAEWKDATGVQP
jgi:hypothetical protein